MSEAPAAPQTSGGEPRFVSRVWTKLRGRRFPILFGILAALAFSFIRNRNVRVHDSAVLTFRNVTLDLYAYVPNPSTALWPAFRAVTFTGLTRAEAARKGAPERVPLPGSGAFERADAAALELTALAVQHNDCPGATLEVSARGLAYGFPERCDGGGDLKAKHSDGYVFGPSGPALPQGTTPLDLTWGRARSLKVVLAAAPDARGGREILNFAETDDGFKVKRITGVLGAPASLATGYLERCDPDTGEKITIGADDLRVLELSYAPDGHAVVLTLDGIDKNRSIKRCSRRASGSAKDGAVPADPEESCSENLCKWPCGGLVADFAALLLALLALVLA
jgi:hypothetical protein